MIKFENGFATETGTVIVYLADANGFYLGKNAENVCIGCGLPAYAYLDAPPEPKDGYAIIRGAEGWELKEDNRGTYYDTATGAAVELTELGQIPENLTALKPESDLCKWDGEKWVIDTEKQAEQFEQRRKTLLQTAISKCDVLKNSLLADYPQTEIESFYKQELEAREYRASNSIDTPLLSQIATMRHIELTVLVDKVIDKANQFAKATGYLIGTRQHFEDLLTAATTIDDLDKIETAINEWTIV